ncbi:Low choriolytic enzyme [Collichthys lucidus]|uniref:Metalloendopeptidase n=1 Tax=Collichthys lucidus TaxID=240159 RepID=A0A4U5TX71_COLLU|nr:Low choriolytic enzyme [Collichthys lucidus]
MEPTVPVAVWRLVSTMPPSIIRLSLGMYSTDGCPAAPSSIRQSSLAVLGRKVDDITELVDRNMVNITGSMENIKNNQDMGYIIDELLLDGDVLIPRTRNAMKCLKEPRACLWPKSANGNVEIPFLISEKYDRAERNTILTPMKDFASKTCIRFIPRTTQTRHISIEPRLGCFSLLGYVGGRQVVSLQKFGCVTHGITQHELLHSMGFYHEQSRSDRDHYVTINWDNIRTSYLSNFKKEDTNNLNTPYDYSSIMHYGRTAFGMHGSETITPFPNPSVPIGQRDRLSNFDILKINKLYKGWNYLW